MKKFILNTGLFLIFTFLFYITSLFLWSTLTPSFLKPNLNYRIGSHGHMYTRISELKNYGNVDILFLGSSHTYRGFDTRIFRKNGYKSFNLGSSSQTPVQTKLLLKRYLNKLNPKLIIYEVYPENLFSSDGVESAVDLIANDPNDLLSFEMALKINNIKIYNTLTYGLIRQLLGLNKNFYEPKVKQYDKYISGGYVERKLGFYKQPKFTQKQITIRNYQFDAFLETVQIIKNKNIELILVYAPIPKSNYERYTNNEYFDSIMSKFSTYYNFNKILNLDDSLHFFDCDHLNQNGVEIFNNKVIEILKDKFY